MSTFKSWHKFFEWISNIHIWGNVIIVPKSSSEICQKMLEIHSKIQCHNLKNGHLTWVTFITLGDLDQVMWVPGISTCKIVFEICGHPKLTDPFVPIQ